MFAVIKAGGKQHRVAANDTITVNRLTGEPGDVIAFEDVVLFGNEGKTELGAPHIAGVTVAGEILEQSRGPKIIAFKKRRRQNSKRKRGHRQLFTVVRITEILTDGKKPDLKAKPKADAAAAPKGGGGQGRRRADEHPGRRHRSDQRPRRHHQKEVECCRNRDSAANCRLDGCGCREI